MRNKIRRHLHLWPETDSLQTAITAVDTTLTVVDSARHPVGSILEIEDELMTVRSLPTATTLTVRRGDRGTTAVAHAAATAILSHGQYDPTDQDLNSLINDGIEWLFPVCMYDIWDDTTTTSDSVLYYSIPLSMEFVDELYITDGRTPEGKRHLRYWQRIGSKVYVPGVLPANRKLIFHGWGRFTRPTDDTSQLCFGEDLEPAVEFYVVASVIKSHEALRTRFTGQSALLEARAGNIPDLLGSSRDWIARAREIRNQHQTIRPTMLRKMNRHV